MDEEFERLSCVLYTVANTLDHNLEDLEDTGLEYTFNKDHKSLEILFTLNDKDYVVNIREQEKKHD